MLTANIGTSINPSSGDTPLMRLLRTLSCIAALALTSVTFTSAQTTHPTTEAQAIITVLNKSADDWNRGDIDAFAASYKNSPDILFMGRTIQHGYAQMLSHYKSAYATRASMGTLTFTQLTVQPLDEHIATVTGNFHLERTATGGGNADGYFLLVMELTKPAEHTPSGWKIVRDDTTAIPSPSK
jgi:ketosteroid isomerase-like protein